MVRETSGKHLFARRNPGDDKGRIYDVVVHQWSSGSCATPPTSWMCAARVCRDDMFLAAGSAIAAVSGEYSFLLLDSQKPRAGKSGGGSIVYSCRSHRSDANSRCRASWKFCVAVIGADKYGVTVYAPCTNGHEKNETEEYSWHRSVARTRYFASMAMKMGDASCQPAKVGQLAISSGKSVSPGNLVPGIHLK